MTDCCCENCGWSEILGSPIICNYNGKRTFRDECCEAWKPKDGENTDMVAVVRCKDCENRVQAFDGSYSCSELGIPNTGIPDFYCAYGKLKGDDISWKIKQS